MSNKPSEKNKSVLDRQFSSFIRESRGEKTYASFSDEIKVTPSTVFRLERGQQSITLRSMGKILDHLGKNIWDVFGKQSD